MNSGWFKNDIHKNVFINQINSIYMCKYVLALYNLQSLLSQKIKPNL